MVTGSVTLRIVIDDKELAAIPGVAEWLTHVAATLTEKLYINGVTIVYEGEPDGPIANPAG